MFIKTFKYDFLAVLHRIKYFFIVFIVSAIGYKICISINYDSIIMSIPEGIFGVAYFICLFATSIVAIVLCMKRYQKSLLTDEGYLTHCLPVKKSTLLLSKFLNVFVYEIITFIITILTVLLFLDNEIITTIFEAFKTEIPNLVTYRDFWPYFILIVLLLLSSSILLISACGMVISIGHSFNQKKTLKSFLVGMLVYSIYQSVVSSITSPFLSLDSVNSFLMYLICINIINIVCIVGTYLINLFVINKHLNLE